MRTQEMCGSTIIAQSLLQMKVMGHGQEWTNQMRNQHELNACNPLESGDWRQGCSVEFPVSALPTFQLDESVDWVAQLLSLLHHQP